MRSGNIIHVIKDVGFICYYLKIHTDADMSTIVSHYEKLKSKKYTRKNFIFYNKTIKNNS